MQVPERCKSCVHWLGHLSKDSNDIRCNRYWGHDPRWGTFTKANDSNHYKPALVEIKCSIPETDEYTPLTDEYGNKKIGVTATPKYVDAYTPIEYIKSTYIEYQTNDEIYLLTEEEFHQLLKYNKDKDMASKKDKLLERARARKKIRQDTQKRHAKHYSKMYGTAPKVIQGRAALPPYQRGEEKVPTGLLPLDLALKGGIPVGTRINISGYPDAGKSTLVNRIEGAFVKYYVENARKFYESQGLDEEEIVDLLENEKIGLIKPENFELNYMIRAMDLENFEDKEAGEVFDRHCDLLATNFAEESTQFVISALNADNADLADLRDGETYSYMLPNQYRLFTLDSIDAEELAEESFGKKMSENMIGDNHRIGGQARLLAEFFRKGYKAAKIPVTLLMVSQHRTANIQTRAKTSVHRGKAHPYFTTLELNLYSPKGGDSDITKEVVCTFGKVHIDADIQHGDTISLYLRPGRGFTKIDNCVPVAFDLGILNKSGSWVSYIDDEGTEHKNQGTDPGKVADWLEGIGLVDELYNRTLQVALGKKEEVVSPGDGAPSQDDTVYDELVPITD